MDHCFESDPQHASCRQPGRALARGGYSEGHAPLVRGQAHLTRSLKRLAGQTPGQIVRGEQQLSFLYKTGAS
jgi:hypothetical protein